VGSIIVLAVILGSALAITALLSRASFQVRWITVAVMVSVAVFLTGLYFIEVAIDVSRWTWFAIPLLIAVYVPARMIVKRIQRT
jgi:hypothetical protein